MVLIELWLSFGEVYWILMATLISSLSEKHTDKTENDKSSGIAPY
jgi:hypothetical protein